MLYNKWLIAFCAVAETGSFLSAAKKLYISQPALTQQINALEKDMGATLFLRSKRGCELTEAGRILYKESKRIIRLCDNTEKKCQEASPAEPLHVRVALSRDDQLNILNMIHQVFRQTNPEINIKMISIPTDAVPAALHDGIIDVALRSENVVDQKEGISYLMLKEVMQCVLMAPEHPLAKKEFLLLSDLKGETLVVPPRGYHVHVDRFRDYVETYLPEIKLAHIDYDISTRYQCAMDNLLMLCPDIFSNTCEPLVSIPLHCSFLCDFGLGYLPEPSPLVQSYITAAKSAFS